MNGRGITIAGALLAGTAVMLGAFGTHGLRSTLTAQQLGWWETGVQYQMWHALALLALAGLRLSGKRAIALLLGIGSVVFSGSLYIMALTDIRFVETEDANDGATIAIVVGLGLALWLSLSALAFGRDLVDLSR